MNSDDHHDNSYEDTGEVVSKLAHIAYAEWRGPDFDLPTLIAADTIQPLIEFAR